MTTHRVRVVSELLNRSYRVVVVAAHPDDEVIGLGGHLHLLRDAWIVHTTDGAPRGVEDREEYARTRSREVKRAVALAGVTPDRLRTLGTVDQESVRALATMRQQLCDLLSELRPDAIVTHPYEGGHPDHDAAALTVAAAVEQMKEKPRVVEFASYHNGNPSGVASMKVGEFLPGPCEAETVILSPESRAMKQRMFECFRSQSEMLANFPVAIERFRDAPAYAFDRAPHEGQLFYEAQGWGVGAEWRRLAVEALRSN